MKLRFLGAAGTVTGSKYLVETAEGRVLVDCGLFQGPRLLREKNWAPLTVNPHEVDAVILTHAHLDHTGYLPRLVQDGFSGPVFSTQATFKLCNILLPDSGHLGEREAEFLNRHGLSRHKPALPLYTQKEAERALQLFSPSPFNSKISVAQDMSVTFLHAGHILGAAIVILEAKGKRIVFSGDLGRFSSATLPDPAWVEKADILLAESTYGNRTHHPGDIEDELAKIINRTAMRGGTVIIPAFAVGRTQTLFYHLERMRRLKMISQNLPIFLDSPMAIDVRDIFCRHLSDHKLTANECVNLCKVATYTRAVEESKRLDVDPVPKIIVSASGMATGGRVLHHLKRYLPDHRSTVVLIGFQAAGTRGASLRDGAKQVKIFGQSVPVEAEVVSFDMLSAHADSNEILKWLSGFKSPPTMTYVVHGEPEASSALKQKIEVTLNWPCIIPKQDQAASLI